MIVASINVFGLQGMVLKVDDFSITQATFLEEGVTKCASLKVYPKARRQDSWRQ
jgi:hypothetical protein